MEASNSDLTIRLGAKEFEFDSVLDSGCLQADVFTLVGEKAVKNCIAGYNSSILAYGQTGSGKTHTMFGRPRNDDQRGLIPRAIELLFTGIGHEEDAIRRTPEAGTVTFTVICSCVELHKENLRDLLCDLTPQKRSTSKEVKLEIREHRSKGPYVAGLMEFPALNADAVHKLLDRAEKNRCTRSTERNAASSRSHAIFAISITKEVTSASGAVTKFTSKLNLVDLAGSERAASSGVGQDEQLKETCGINSSLVALGRVIFALNKAQSEANEPRAGQGGSSLHVPYRDNKLTYLLKESLGGNARTFFIACVSPGAACAEETLSTLRFARDARAVRNAARVAVTVEADPAALLREVEALQQANRKLVAELERLEEAKQQLQMELTERVSLHNTQAAEARAALLAAQRASTKLEQSNAELAGAQAAVQAARRDAEAERERSAALAAKAAEAEAALRMALSATSDVEERFRQLELQVAEARAAGQTAVCAAAAERERSGAAAAEAAQAQAALADARQAAADVQRSCEDLALQVSFAQAAEQAAREEARAERRQAAVFAAEAAELRAELSVQRLAVAELQARCCQLTEGKGCLEDTVQAAHHATELSTERCAALGSELAQARAELAAAQQAASSSEQRCLELAAALARSKALAQAARRDAVAEGDRAAALTSEVAELRAALNAQREAAGGCTPGAMWARAGDAGADGTVRRKAERFRALDWPAASALDAALERSGQRAHESLKLLGVKWEGIRHGNLPDDLHPIDLFEGLPEVDRRRSLPGFQSDLEEHLQQAIPRSLAQVRPRAEDGGPPGGDGDDEHVAAAVRDVTDYLLDLEYAAAMVWAQDRVHTLPDDECAQLYDAMGYTAADERVGGAAQRDVATPPGVVLPGAR
ncbi:hypothetical protein GPECTOR_29g74 [Gonium pectorale]|uniref:Kinesin-like protein n=1 Tax=Gonium pectorale TaxID=33097 RepID=A0A150GEM3_GONPE|nr:hypothetical protein GPECTOR_29g74 [Gonium pectorale]|eukprot:KXZ48299.1 hypothetical protein GPECTOR_29g74 [Gonium pectorale]